MEAGRRRAAVAGLHLAQDVALRHGGPRRQCTGHRLETAAQPVAVIDRDHRPVHHNPDKADRPGRRRDERGAVVGGLNIDAAVTAEPRPGRGIEGAQNRRPRAERPAPVRCRDRPCPGGAPDAGVETSGPAGNAAAATTAAGAEPSGIGPLGKVESARSNAARQAGIFMPPACCGSTQGGTANDGYVDKRSVRPAAGPDDPAAAPATPRDATATDAWFVPWSRPPGSALTATVDRCSPAPAPAPDPRPAARRKPSFGAGPL